MKLLFADRAWEDYLHWQQTSPKICARLTAMIAECKRTPFTGTGKPEPLKGKRHGWWSRRLTLADRLVYRVNGSGDDQRLEIAQCRLHY